MLKRDNSESGVVLRRKVRVSRFVSVPLSRSKKCSEKNRIESGKESNAESNAENNKRNRSLQQGGPGNKIQKFSVYVCMCVCVCSIPA